MFKNGRYGVRKGWNIPRREAHIWVRDEVKPREFRTPVTPEAASALRKAGHTLTVEQSANRCYDDSAYAAAGCHLAPAGSWTQAPDDAYVLGLKELPTPEPSALRHRHIYFAHCYKYQAGWRELLARFAKGGGEILDLEFLVDERGVRVAAFSYMAGVAGAAISLAQWATSAANPAATLPKADPWPSRELAARDLAAQIVAAKKGSPSVVVVGAGGRSGHGCLDFLTLVNGELATLGAPKMALHKWDRAETAKGGPFLELLEHDVVMNCIYLGGPAGTFLPSEYLHMPYAARRLTVFGDVSCDVSSPFNPFPFSDRNTSVFAPVRRVQHAYFKQQPRSLDVIAIDHLPSLLPRDSSENFSAQLLPHLIELDRSDVWDRARQLFLKKRNEAADHP